MKQWDNEPVTYDPATDPALKKVKVSEVFDAIEKNGLPKIRKTFFKYEREGLGVSDHWIKDGNVIAACALGQAAINLSVDADSLYNTLNDIDNEKYTTPYIGDRITELNDSFVEELSLPEIAQYMRDHYAAFLDEEIYVSIRE